MRYLILLMILLAALRSFSQEKIKLGYVNIKSDFAGQLFYSKEKIKEISFVIVAADMLDAMNFNQLLDKQSFAKNSSQDVITKDTLLCKVKLKYHPEANEIRAVLENTNLDLFYINGKKYWVSSLMTKDEAYKKFLGFDLKEMQFKPEYNNPEMPEYYDYKIYSLNTKLKYMYGGDYPKYFYDGYITKFLDDIDNVKKDQRDYIEQSGKQ